MTSSNLLQDLLLLKRTTRNQENECVAGIKDNHYASFPFDSNRYVTMLVKASDKYVFFFFGSTVLH